MLSYSIRHQLTVENVVARLMNQLIKQWRHMDAGRTFPDNWSTISHFRSHTEKNCSEADQTFPSPDLTIS